MPAVGEFSKKLYDQNGMLSEEKENPFGGYAQKNKEAIYKAYERDVKADSEVLTNILSQTSNWTSQSDMNAHIRTVKEYAQKYPNKKAMFDELVASLSETKKYYGEFETADEYQTAIYGKGNINLQTDETTHFYIYEDKENNETVLIPCPYSEIGGFPLESQAIEQYKKTGKYYAKYPGIDANIKKQKEEQQKAQEQAEQDLERMIAATGGNPSAFVPMSATGMPGLVAAAKGEETPETPPSAYEIFTGQASQYEAGTNKRMAEDYMKELQERLGYSDNAFKQMELDHRKRVQEAGQRLAENLGPLASGISVVSNLADSFAVFNKMRHSLSGQYSYRDDLAADFTGAIRQERGRAWGEALGNSDVGNFVYSGIMSIADMGAAIAIGGAVGAGAGATNLAKGVTGFILSSSAASSTVTDAHKRGLSGEQAVSLGIAAGAIEWITERFSIEAFWADPKTYFGYFIKNVATEGSEEAMSSVLNAMADVIIAADKSEIIQKRKAYMADGMSGEEAVLKVLSDLAGETLLDALAGAFTGAILSGTRISVDAYNSVRYSTPSKYNKTLADTKTWVKEKFGNLTGAVERKGLGTVTIDHTAASKAIDNVKTQDQALAFAAVNRIVQKGKVMDFDGVKMIVSPVTLNGNSHIASITLTQTAENKYTVSRFSVDGGLVYSTFAEQTNADTATAASLENGEQAQPQEQAYEQDPAQPAQKYVPGLHEYGRIGVEPSALDLSFQAMDDQQRASFIAALEQATGTRIVFDESIEGDGTYQNGVITINPNTATPMSVFKHELTHFIETSGIYNDFMNFVMDESQSFKEWRGGKTIDDMVKERIDRYAKHKVVLNELEAKQEILADFVADRLLTDANALLELKQKKRNVFERLLDWFRNLFNRSKGTPLEQELQKMESMFRQAVEQQATGKTVSGNTKTKYRIETLADGRRYVKADRQVITGNDPLNWEQQIIDYVNEIVVSGKELLIPTDDGDVLTINGRTAWKLGYRNDTSQGKIDDTLYRVKGDAAGHIDELTEVSTLKNSKPNLKTNRRTPFGKDGFEYRTAYFLDKDNSYYRLTLSVGIDGSVKTVYNIGDIKKVSFPVTGSKAKGGTTPYGTNVSQKNNGVNTQYMQKGKKNSFAPTAERETTAQQTPTMDDTTAPDEAVLDNFSDEQLLDVVRRRNPKMNPLAISQLTEQDANTTPSLRSNGQLNRKGDGDSRFAESLQKTSIYDERFKKLADTDDNISRYDTVSNKKTMEAANQRINEGGESYVLELVRKPAKQFTAEDVAAGFILMSRYQKVGDYKGMIAIAEKLREAGTAGGQMVQIFSILSRMTPDGMIAYAQNELSKAYEAMLENHSRNWGEQNKDKFRLTDEDVEYIRRRTMQAAKLPEGRDKNILLGEIASRIQSKIPPDKGQAYRAWQRVAMLLNPKTQIRNVMGNATMVPSHVISDIVGTGIDKIIAAKTGVRTTSGVHLSGKAFKQGLYESWDDFVRDIDTRGLGQDRFEVAGHGNKNFNEHHTGNFAEGRNKFSRALNALDRFNSFLLDAGDRSFYQMWFVNSINGQMIANNVNQPTAEMIEIATQDALSRTWQDDNLMTKSVKAVKGALNSLNVDGRYGLGDVLIKFTKTPANLTKAMFDFSPAGLVKALTLDIKTFSDKVGKGAVTAMDQRRLVRNISNGITGSLMHIVAYALASAGWITGEKDEDADVASFERYNMGHQPYSFKIGNMSFSYDWAQPAASSLAIWANYFEDKENAELTGEAKEWYQHITDAFGTGTQVLFDQSFMQSLQNLFADDSFSTNLINALLSDVSAPVPQVLSQAAASLDPVIRNTYEYDNDLQTAWNKVLNRIPGLRNTLAPSVDVMGNEKQQLENGVLRTIVSFFSPANVSVGYKSDAADEVYRLYQKTGSASVIPPQAPNYVSKNGGKVTLSSQEKAEYQKVTGKLAEKTLEDLLKNDAYKELSDDSKAELLSAVYSYSKQVANRDVLGLELNESAAKADKFITQGIPAWQYFLIGELKSSEMGDKDGNGSISQEEAQAILDSTTLTKKQKEIMWYSFNSNWKYNPYKKRYY